MKSNVVLLKSCENLTNYTGEHTGAALVKNIRHFSDRRKKSTHYTFESDRLENQGGGDASSESR